MRNSTKNETTLQQILQEKDSLTDQREEIIGWLKANPLPETSGTKGYDRLLSHRLDKHHQISSIFRQLDTLKEKEKYLRRVLSTEKKRTGK